MSFSCFAPFSKSTERRSQIYSSIELFNGGITSRGGSHRLTITLHAHPRVATGKIYELSCHQFNDSNTWWFVLFFMAKTTPPIPICPTVTSALYGVVVVDRVRANKLYRPVQINQVDRSRPPPSGHRLLDERGETI